tara:strand:- start:1699 stop:2994 length:1296 start_codon:yes stop_codon:yes gene_type:complete
MRSAFVELHRARPTASVRSTSQTVGRLRRGRVFKPTASLSDSKKQKVSTMSKPKPKSSALVASGVVPATQTGGLCFSTGEDGKWNLAEATHAVFPTRFKTLSTARKAVRRGEIAVSECEERYSNHDECDPPATSRRGDFRPKPGDHLDLIQRMSSNEVELLDPLPDYVPKLTIAYEDEHCAVVVKPEGIASVGGGNKKRKTDDESKQEDTSEWTAERLLPYYLQPTTTAGALSRPRPVHRLDQTTGGLLVVAKTRVAASALSKAFEDRKPVKKYRALLVWGNCMGTQSTGSTEDQLQIIDTPLSGKPSITHWRVIQQVASDKYGKLTLVDLYPKTGRTHQLRRHASQTLGAPILGDKRYTQADTMGGIDVSRGLFLWAVEILIPKICMPWLQENENKEKVSEKPKESDEWLRVAIDDPEKFSDVMGSIVSR